MTSSIKLLMEEVTFAEVWQELSQTDVSEKIEKKGNLNFLSWAWSWGVLMEHYPHAEYSFQDPDIMPDGSVMVFCTVSIGQLSRQMWLPVMDYKNKAISNPNSFQMNTAKMRCLVKCLAMFGLGHHIYAGEDIHTDASDKEAEKEKQAQAQENQKIGIDQLKKINDLMEFTKSDEKIFLSYFKVDSISDLTIANSKVAIEKLEIKKSEQEKEMAKSDLKEKSK